MHPILFYGVPEGCSLGSIVALEWSGRPYRLCRVQMPEVVSGADYRRLNPVGETPSLMTARGDVISESLAILNHIGAWRMETGAPGSGPAFAQGSRDFDRLNAMLGFLNTSFFGAFSPLWYALEHGSEGAEKAALTAYGRAMVAKTHGQLEALLGGGDWLLGRRSLADAYFFGIARWADFHQAVDRRDYPGLHRLFEKLKDDPAVRFALAIEHGEGAQSSGGFAGQVSLEETLAMVKEVG
ncbi:glutathione S-transferase [Pelagibius sp. 7325]|uniref:glutathione S-transferase n=1 Tax=Pelagibius sp. 7325 TaxID=3131994 RepID=UPI0030EB122F